MPDGKELVGTTTQQVVSEMVKIQLLQLWEIDVQLAILFKACFHNNNTLLCPTISFDLYYGVQTSDQFSMTQKQIQTPSEFDNGWLP